MTPAGQFERLRARLAESDPVVVRAIDEVDLGLLHWSLSLSPWQRLRAASVALNTLRRFRRAASATGRLASAD